MKTFTTITSLLFITCLGLFPQNYESFFGNESTKWWIMDCPYFCSTNILDFKKDSIVKGITYKYSFRNFLRQSEDHSKFYMIPSHFTEESLIADLELEMGDTFNIEFQYHKKDFAIVDSIYFVNGKKVIEFDYYLNCWIEYMCPLESSKLKLKFFEGIGSNLFDYITYMYLNCIEKDGVKVYKSYIIKDFQYYNQNWDKEDSCSFIILGDGIGISEAGSYPKIIPNPIVNEGRIVFVNPNNEKFILELYNSGGISCYKTFTNMDFFQLSSDKFNPGIYFFLIYNNNGNDYKGKLFFAD